jgi:septum formation protein
VLTGWTAFAARAERFGVSESRVRFHPRHPDELVDYVRRTAPYDKAGAYAIQGDDGWLIAGVDGSRSNVMGLPIADVVSALADLGVARSTPHGG